MIGLDPFAIALEGTALIEASAGTGKTYTISTLYLRFLLERGLLVGEILVVTYTRAATAELRERIRTRLGEAMDAIETASTGETGDAVLDAIVSGLQNDDERARAIRRLSDAISGFDEAAILTIHGFCQGVLQENAFESSAAFDVDFLADEAALRDEVVSDYWDPILSKFSLVCIGYLAGANLRREVFLELAMRAARSAPLELIPAPEAGPIDSLEKRWQEALDRVRAIWQTQRSEALALVARAAESKDLKNGSYRPANLAEILDASVDLALANPGMGSLAGNKPFLLLTRSRLVGARSKNGTVPEHALFDACETLREVDEEMKHVLEQKLIGLERELIRYVETEMRARKDAAGVQSYDDLMFQLATALRGPGGTGLARQIRERHCVALIDEFQDTDELQYEIARTIWHQDSEVIGDESRAAPALFLIGDPKQAIYAFRGADVFTYLSAKEDAAENRFTLDTNWRSDPSLIRGVNALFDRSPSPFLIDGIPFESVGAEPDARDRLHGTDGVRSSLEFLWVPSDDAARPLGKADLQMELSKWVAGDIARLLEADTMIDDSPVKPGDVAVLCRNNQQAGLVANALEAIGIPAALLGTTNVFDSAEAEEMQRLLMAMAEPSDARSIRAALATSLFGLRGAELYELQFDEARWDRWLESFQSWHQSWTLTGFIQALHQLYREAEVHLQLLGQERGERRLTNFLHLAELLETASSQEHLGPRGLVAWLSRMRSGSDARSNAIGEDGELRLEGDAEAVKLVTVHKSKGIEYPIVYCPFLWEGDGLRVSEKRWVLFHDRGDADQLTLDLGSDAKEQHLQVADFEARAEGLRLLYVALTRAKHRCSIVWGRFKDTGSSGLFHLLNSTDANSPPSSSQAKNRFKEMDDGEFISALKTLAEESNDCVAVRELVREPGNEVSRSFEAEELMPQVTSREISTIWRHSSFSALASTDPHPGRIMRPADEGVDHDAHAEDSNPDLGALPESNVRLQAFPSGAAAGTLLHSILEHIDFDEADPNTWGERIEETLSRNGFDPSWRGVLVEALAEIVKTRFEESGPSLDQIRRAQRIDELEFLLPVGRREGVIDPRFGMRVADLADVFSAHAATPFMRDYAERLRELRFEPLAGYLKGFIDLVFQWQERYYLVDYKSNHLGNSPLHYQPDQLQASMIQHHYVLQYHLYTVALHRFLTVRLRDYDYDQHFGGSYYLFLRGLAPENPTGSGVYCDRPSRGLIESLSDLLSQTNVGRGPA